MNSKLKESGLAKLYNIRSLTDDLQLGKYLGKHVRYKKELLTEEFIRKNGTICIDTLFLIKEVQTTHDKTKALRGYFKGDSFGRVLRVNEVEIIGEYHERLKNKLH